MQRLAILCLVRSRNVDKASSKASVSTTKISETKYIAHDLTKEMPVEPRQLSEFDQGFTGA